MVSRSYRIGARATEEVRELRALRRSDAQRRKDRTDWRYIGPAPDWAHDAGMQYEREGDNGRTEYARTLPEGDRLASDQPSAETIRAHARRMADAAASLDEEFGR